MQIKVYSTPTCPYCVQAKQYFKSRNIDFEDIDVSLDHEKAHEMIDLSGQMGVPVIKIDNDVIVGFDKAKIDQHLK
ncbi:TPA: NrdH-redoxin [Candidatus Berkelbacteria bacterium]|uniref:Glutaredoxin-like protein, YruB-family n=1 Tax=Berkelbacteria bacterium GW2011_GWE1_39_12 TaxID=1618337 RepID=A0A0G4B2C8_9BACT|nr:MAG: Glutaredoxin-like protein, YruB-family [Berkelbacteria bacterium GW2011_GWE1_39_12]HBO60696.1 NrdH-redoxin [Candidatus Berkelbacteria bacterium]